MSHQYFLERARDRMLPPYQLYDPNKFASAPQNEKMAARIFNAQFTKLYYYAPEIRGRWRYLERAEYVQTPFGRILVQAGAIIPKLWPDMKSKIHGAMGAIKAHGKTANIDAMLSLRPSAKRSLAPGQSMHSVRYVTIKLGPPKARKEVTFPYGWFVYILRHPTFSPVFPVTYEPINPFIVSYEELPDSRLVQLDKLDELDAEPNGLWIKEAAIDMFNEILARGEDVSEVHVTMPGSGQTEVEVHEAQYNTWFPKNLRLETVQPTWSYEANYDEYEAFKTSMADQHYPNDFTMELDYFNMGNVE